MCGITNALIIKGLGDNEIISIEKFVQSKLEIQLNKLEPGLNADLIRKEDFFSNEYAICPANFEFTIGEKMLIKQISEHVSNIADTERKNSGLGFFSYSARKRLNSEDLAKTGMFEHSRKRYFISGTKSNKSVNMKPISIQISADLEKSWVRKIFSDMKNSLQPYIDVTNEEHITSDLICIENESDQGIRANIICFLCKQTGPTITRISVSYKISKGQYYWNVSNFKRHLIRAHTTEINQDNGLDNIANSSTKEQNNVCIDLQIETVGGQSNTMHSSLCDEMNVQISAQILKMNTQAELQKEKLESMEYVFDELGYDLHVAVASGDGSCLYRSITHQLYGEKLNSRKNTQLADNFRREVVEYINNNYERFAIEIRRTVMR